MKILVYLFAFVKLLVFGALLFSYFALAFVIRLLVWNKIRHCRLMIQIVSLYSKVTLKLIGIKAEQVGEVNKKANYLIVSNHLSYTDVLIFSAFQPSCFVTSVEVRDTPVLGHICRLAGCLFVERRNKNNIREEIAEISDALKEDLSVAIFPEATSSNGEQILRFRSPLYNAAIFSQRPVLPVCLNYKTVDGEIIDRSNRDDVFWYGDMSFFSHLWRLLMHREICVEMIFDKPIDTRSAFCSKTLAKQSQEIVEKKFVPCKASGAQKYNH